MINPARAIPPPVNRPMLFWIADRDMCPRMMAGMPVRQLKIVSERIPQTRLPTALPSVRVSTFARALDGGPNGCPQWLQNAPSALSRPHELQRKGFLRSPVLLFQR